MIALNLVSVDEYDDDDDNGARIPISRGIDNGSGLFVGPVNSAFSSHIYLMPYLYGCRLVLSVKVFFVTMNLFCNK